MKTVLITGGSSGLGYEISRHFARDGYRLCWIAQPADELSAARQRLLSEFPAADIQTLAQDLTQPEAAQTSFDWAMSLGSVEVLINNAGIGTYGFLQESPQEREIQMIQLNVLGVYRMTRLFLDEMLRQQSGTIINICSISAFQPVPRMNTYASTKAFIQHFSLGLAQELKLQQAPVHVLTVFPAAIRDTAFQVAAAMQGVKTFDGLVTTTAAEVAKDVWQGFQRKKNRVITGQKARWTYAFQALIPGFIQRALISQETEKI